MDVSAGHFWTQANKQTDALSLHCHCIVIALVTLFSRKQDQLKKGV